jgi:hypothetical protein
MPAPTKRGQFVWHELMSTDPDAAARFYGKVIGWKTQSWPQNPSYRMWLAGETPVGGLMRLPDEAQGSPPFWATYIGVPDVDAAVRQATSLGARVQVPAQDIPGAGRFAGLMDPQGAYFSVYSSNQPQPAEPSLGGFTWHELATTDYRAAWEFYRKMFGWQHTSSMDMGPAGVYFMFGDGGERPLGGIYNKTLEVPMPYWLPYVSVKSADDVAKATPRLGGKVMTGPMEVAGGDRIVMAMDPQGAAFAVHWISAGHDAGVAETTKPKRKQTSRSKAKPKRKAKAKATAKPKAKPKPKARPKKRRR